MYISYTKVKSK